MNEGAGTGLGSTRPVAKVDRTLESLIPRFMQRRRDDADTIESLVSQGDFETIKSLGHSIKGSGGGYGFDPVTEYGSALEVAADACDGPSVIAAARQMRAYIDAVTIEYVDD